MAASKVRKPAHGPSVDVIADRDRWEALTNTSLSSTQAAAEKWRTGLAAFVTLVTGGLAPQRTSRCDRSHEWVARRAHLSRCSRTRCRGRWALARASRRSRGTRPSQLPGSHRPVWRGPTVRDLLRQACIRSAPLGETQCSHVAHAHRGRGFRVMVGASETCQSARQGESHARPEGCMRCSFERRPEPVSRPGRR